MNAPVIAGKVTFNINDNFIKTNSINNIGKK